MAAVPLLIFVLAAAPRAWLPDLVPFGGTQAVALSEARHLSAQSTAQGLVAGAGGRSPLALASPFLDAVRFPIEAWVVVRAILDGVAAFLLYLTARSLSGSGPAILAGLLYGLAPWALVLSRDLAAPSLPLLEAVALFAAVRVVQGRSMVIGVLFGAATGLLVRFDSVGWAALPAFAATLLLVRCHGRVVVAALIGWGLCAGPVIAPILSEIARADRGRFELAADALLLANVASGVGAHRWLSGMAELPPVLEALAPAAVGVALVLVALGTVSGILGARRGYAGALVPSLWVGGSLVSLAALGGQLRIEAVHPVLPALALLMALAAGHWGRPLARLRPLTLGLSGMLAAFGGLTIAGLLTSATTWAERPSGRSYADWSARPAGVGAEVGFESRLPTTTARFWEVIAHDVRDAVERTGADVVDVLAPDGPFSDGARSVSSLLGDSLDIRSLPTGIVPLPLEREAVFLILPGAEAPPEFQWPSARLGGVALPGTDAVARTVTLRPRPIAHWLATRDGGTEIRFANDAALLSARSRERPDGESDVELVWLLPGAPLASSKPVAGATILGRSGAARPQDAHHWLLPAPRPGAPPELIVQRLTMAPMAAGARAGGATVRLVTRTGETIRATSGTATSDGGVEVPNVR